jgi:hypothetical protein
MRKIAVSLTDSQDLRVILSVLYTITEVIRNEKDSGSTEYQNEVEAFCTDLANSSDEELLIVKLLGMVTRFCSGAAPHFPMKKVLLLLWKLILVTLGGMCVLKDLKDEKRAKAGLPRLDEDTMEIAKTMRASSPPASASDLLEAQNQKRNTRPFRRVSYFTKLHFGLVAVSWKSLNLLKCVELWRLLYILHYNFLFIIYQTLKLLSAHCCK